MTLPTADTVIETLHRSRYVADAARELGIGERSVYNVLVRAGRGSPAQYLYGVTPVGTSPQVQTYRTDGAVHEAKHMVERSAYTGAPPPDFDDVAETHRVDVRPTDPVPPAVTFDPPVDVPFREERILFVPDEHFPFEDKRAWQTLLRVGRFFQPHRIVVIGDFVDAYSISFHDKSPSRVSKLVEEIAEAERGLDDLDALGAERRHFLMGNHENRMRRHIAKVSPMLHGWPGLTIEDGLHLHSRGWTFSRYQVEYNIGDLAVCHDWGKCGVNALKQVVETLGRNVVQGHTHRAQTYCGASPRTGESIRGDSFGWGGSFDELDYCHRAMAAMWWTHACGVGWTRPDGSVRREVVRFIDGKARVDGQAA